MEQIWGNILGTFVGAVLGIPVGCLVNSLSSKQINRTRRERLWAAIKETVIKNISLVGELEVYVRAGSPFINVDLSLLDSTANLKYEVLDDIDLCREIDDLRFELEHLSRMVDLLLSLDFNPSARLAINTQGRLYDQLRPELIDSITKRIKFIKPLLGKLRQQSI